jgi:hypothetical protein
VAGCPQAKPGPTTEDRIRALEEQVERERQAAVEAAAAYLPTVAWRTGDPAVPADLLRQLPGVANVEVLVFDPRTKPGRLLVHVRDWHYVPRQSFALDVGQAGKLVDAEVEGLYREHLLQVELVQIEQLLRQLLRVLLRWFPQRQFVCAADGNYATHDLARLAARYPQRLTYLSHFYADANLYEPAPPVVGKKPAGRPRKKGRKLPAPAEVVKQAKRRQRLNVAWYGGGRREVEVVTGTAHW